MSGIRVYDPKIIVLISAAFLILSALATLLYPFPFIRWAIIILILSVAFIMRKRIIEVFRQMKRKD